MGTQKRQSSILSSAASSSSATAGKRVGIQPAQKPKKRVPLGEITNRCSVPRKPAFKPNQGFVGCIASKRTAQLASSAPVTGPRHKSLPAPAIQKIPVVIHPDHTSIAESTVYSSNLDSNIRDCSMDSSPSRLDEGFVSLDESTSTCESMKNSDVEYIDTVDGSKVVSLERRTLQHLSISDDAHAEAVLTTDSKKAKVLFTGADFTDPQFCATYACDIYDHLRIAETKKMPSIDFMEKIQKDINASMRAILIDWLVEVAEEYRLVPDTLYLTVNYIDRYLSVNVVNKQRLQLLGVTCMLVASKFEEVCAPQVEEFCYITDNTYVREEVLQMESDVLKYLDFELTTPTIKCFLRRFIRADQESNQAPPLQLEFLASYLAELSLLEYSFLRYIPSFIAASAVFLAKFILLPSSMPWTKTLRHYTRYQPSELYSCVKALHKLHNDSQSSNLPSIKEKYKQHKYKCVANLRCPAIIPSEYFRNLSD